MLHSEQRTMWRRRPLLITMAVLAGAAVLVAAIAAGIWGYRYMGASILSLQGYTALTQGRDQAALQLYQESVRLNGNDAWAQYNLGVCYSRLDRHDEAAAAYALAAKLDPNDESIQLAMLGTQAYIAARDGDDVRSEKLYREALKHDARDAHTWHELGGALHRLGRYEEAIKAYRSACLFEPENDEYSRSIGFALDAQAHDAFVRSDYEMSAGLYLDATKYLPDSASAWFNLTAALYAQHRLDEALDAIRRAVELDPGNEEYQELLEQITASRKAGFSDD